ncbi:helix-turn-helix domain-containing protein [Glycomyces sp. NPDC048151]|uniref:helix-turn-helix domain-containing protein n=1 Tax=Glycomyces sp. NPDC048151 TaxID=3364002 RepID=UPI003718B765
MRMRDIRKAQGLTVDDLVDRLADIGRPDITNHRIFNMQAGRVKPYFDVVLAIANALGVSPLTFLTVPDDASISIEVAPSVEISPIRFNAWSTGARPLPGGDEEVFAEYHPYGTGLTSRQGNPEERAQALVTRLTARLSAVNEVVAALETEASEFAAGLQELDGEDLPEEQRRAIDALMRTLRSSSPKSGLQGIQTPTDFAD